MVIVGGVSPLLAQEGHNNQEGVVVKKQVVVLEPREEGRSDVVVEGVMLRIASLRTVLKKT